MSGGVIIVGLFGLLLVSTFLLALHRILRGGGEAYWVVLFIYAYIGFSISESSFLQSNNLGWVLFVATSAKLFAFEAPYWRPTQILKRGGYTGHEIAQVRAV